MSQNAQIIYDRLNSKEDLIQLVSDKVTEDLYLEFKTKHDATNSALHESDKKNLSEAISQFANSDGGVLIFGIKTSSPNDYASDLSFISNIDDFHMRLQDYLVHAIQPSVDGIKSKVIKETESTGCVLFNIPASLKTPHRSMITREYFKRNQNGKQRMEHFDLEDMFGRRQKPNLVIELVPSDNAPISQTAFEKNNSTFLYTIFVSNQGRYIAKNAMFVITGPDDELVTANVVPIANGPSVNSISDLPHRKKSFQINSQSNFFYPDLVTRIGTLELKISEDAFYSTEKFLITWEAYAEDMQNKKGEITIGYKFTK